jgi:hypothetical protein
VVIHQTNATLRHAPETILTISWLRVISQHANISRSTCSTIDTVQQRVADRLQWIGDRLNGQPAASGNTMPDVLDGLDRSLHAAGEAEDLLLTEVTSSSRALSERLAQLESTT